MKVSFRIALILLFSLASNCKQAQAQTQDSKNIVINAVGDTMMGTLYPDKRIPPENGATIFKFTGGYITNGNPDIVMANLEGSVTHYNKTWKNVGSGKSFAFQMPPHLIQYLKAAGFNIVTTANNHAMDFGTKGYSDTRKYLSEADIQYVGNKGEVVVRQINGKKVAIVGFGWGDKFNNILNISESRKFLERVAASNDVVIVTFHGGSEGNQAIHVRDKMETLYGNSRGNLVKFSHMAVDAGADLIIGHGPHLPRAMELYKGRLIAYSLGNFATYAMFNTSGPRKYTLVLNVELADDGSFVKGKILPLIQYAEGKYRGIPRVDPDKNSIYYIKKMTNDDFPGTPLLIDSDGNITPKVMESSDS